MLIYRKIQISLSAIALILATATVTLSQASDPYSSSAKDIVATRSAKNIDASTSADDCAKMLEKALADLDGKDAVITAKTAEITNKAEIIKDQDERFAKMLKILQDFAAVEKANKKSFWKEVGNYLKKTLKTVTDPAMVRTILEVIVLVKALEK